MTVVMKAFYQQHKITDTKRIETVTQQAKTVHSHHSFMGESKWSLSKFKAIHVKWVKMKLLINHIIKKAN